MNLDLLKQRRQALGLSQADVARGVGLILGVQGRFTQQSYAAIESGQTQRSRYLPQIAQVLGLGLAELDPSLSSVPPVAVGKPGAEELLARYLRCGWAAMCSHDMLAFGFDPFRHGPVSEAEFRHRAADLLDPRRGRDMV